VARKEADLAAAEAPAVLPVGRDGLLVRFSLTVEPWAVESVQVLSERLEEAGVSGVSAVQKSLTSLLVRFDPGETSRDALAEALSPILSGEDWQAAEPRPAERVWKIPAAFGGEHGPGLEEAAELAGMSAEEAIEQMLATPTRVLAIGFAPGQPYLGLLPEEWNLPRMSEVAPNVPQGALCVAIRQLVLFTNASPTGWRQVARTAFRTFRPEADDPAPLKPGDEVRLVRASAEEMDALLDGGDPDGGASCETRR